jgi:hypothetical protein
MHQHEMQQINVYLNIWICRILILLKNRVLHVLSSFVKLCECWLRTPLDSYLFCYYYPASQYAKLICDGIGLSLRRHRRDEYILALFKGCWKHSQKKWFLVDMHVQPSWENKLLFPPVIKAQRTKSPMNMYLAALVKHAVVLRKARPKACHCIKEFHLWWFRSLGRRDKCVYECLWMADPSHEPAVGKLSSLSCRWWWYDYSNLTLFLFCIALPQEEINKFVAWLFNKDPPTMRPIDLPLPYINENPPRSVRATILYNNYSFCN